MKKLLLPLLLLMGATLYAQQTTYQLRSKNGGEQYTMNMVDQSPDNVSPLYIGVDLFAAFSNLSMGPGISAEYRLNPKFYLSANAVLPFDLLQMGKSVDKSSFEMYKPFSQLGATATYFFSNHEKFKSKNLYFGSGMRGGTEVQHYAKIKIPKAIKYGLRVGYQYNSLPIHTVSDTRDYSTNAIPQVFQSHAVAIGIGRSGQYQYQASTVEFGTKGGQVVNQVYLDALVLLSGTTYYPPQGGSPSDYVQVDSKAGKVGWRFGWNSVSGKSPSGIGVRYGFEFGSIPATVKKGSGGYFVFKIGFGFLSNSNRK
jgi:hypothetical protein